MNQSGPFIFIAVFILTPALQPVAAQDSSPLRLADGSSMRIDGTSNKSDWSVEVTDMEGQLWLTRTDGGFDPDSVYFVTRSGELESDVSPIMDRLMHRALKSAQHPAIVYSLGSRGVERVTADDTLRWSTVGTLDLAGVRDTLSAAVKGFADSAGRYVFTGSHRMSMRQHGIQPPTAMFGALHTSEWVSIRFRLVFGKN